jgi:CHAD domain-containing protein
MAKAKQIPGLEASMTYAEAAGRTVAIRGEEIFEHSEGVLDMGDIERVHAMRVATRRLRAVLEIYAPCFPHDELRPVLRDVKQLADALGARRDPDVELLALEQFAVSVGPDERPGVEHFIARTRAEQEEGNRHLELALEEIERSALRARIARLATLAARSGHDGAGGEAHGEQEGARGEHDAAERGQPQPEYARRHHDVPARSAAESARRPGPPHEDDAPTELLADRVYGLDGERS